MPQLRMLQRTTIIQLTILCWLSCLVHGSARDRLNPVIVGHLSITDTRTLNNWPSELKAELSRTRDLRQCSYILLDWLSANPMGQPTILIGVAQQALRLAALSGDEDSEAKALFYYIKHSVDYNPDNIDLEPNIIHLEKAIEIFEAENLYDLRYQAFDYLFYLRYQKCANSRKNNCLENIITDLNQIVENIPTSQRLSDLLLTKGSIYHVLRDTMQSRVWIDSSYIVAHNADYLKGKALSQMTLALGADTVDAPKLFLEAINYFKALGDTLMLSKAWRQYGQKCLEVYKPNRSEAHSLSWLQRSIYCFEEAEKFNGYLTCDLFKLIAEAYHYRYIQYSFPGQDRGEMNKSLKAAKKYYQLTAEWAAKQRDIYCLFTVKEDLAKVCFEGYCEIVLENIQDTIENLFFEQSHLVESAERSFASYRLRKERQANMYRTLIGLGLLLSFLLLGAILFYIFYQKQKLENTKNKLSALKARMDTHFMSNVTLNINSLITQGRKEEASNYLIDFERLCRSLLKYSDKDFITLKEELEILTSYLSLEKLRMKGQLEFELNVDEELPMRKLQIISLLLQPFVENAVKHGIKNKRQGDKGRLRIEVTDLDEWSFRCLIEDDGIGRNNAQKRKVISDKENQSFGLEITKKRIEQIPGASYQILDVDPSAKQYPGTRVVIHYPKIYQSGKTKSKWIKKFELLSSKMKWKLEYICVRNWKRSVLQSWLWQNVKAKLKLFLLS